MEVDLINKFEEIYSLESDAIFRFCLLRVSDRDQALDITQETFLRLWQSIQDGNDILNNKAFLFTIARRLVIDWYRKKKSLSLDYLMIKDSDGESRDFVDEHTNIDNLLSGAEGRFLLKKINEISSSNRDSVYLRFVEDLSPGEIAKILGISTNAASVRINRGLEELKKISGYNIDKQK